MFLLILIVFVAITKYCHHATFACSFNIFILTLLIHIVNNFNIGLQFILTNFISVRYALLVLNICALCYLIIAIILLIAN